MTRTIVLERRYRGPEASGNGGYTCGRVAAFVPAAAVEVTLRVPPPLETPLTVTGDGDVEVFDGDRLVAEARAAELDLVPAPPVAFEEAARLAAAQPPDPDHPFPGCFTCGPAGDGLRLKPTPVGDGRVVAPWRVEESAPELVWAALDCPGAFAVNPDFARGISVLGRLTAHVETVPQRGDECVVVAWRIGGEGRKLLAGTAVYRGDTPLARAAATWILVGDEFRDRVPSAS
ncbi:MAG TPA: hypothetical protein VFA56_00750 [Gaiellaceae bacterium]|nr:hypothetical protein [Gaiellaceae bacterium]